MAEQSPDLRAAEDIARACHTIAGHTKVDRIALLAYIQANMTQCAVQVLVNFLRQKNMFGDAELTKRLAEAYDDMAAQLTRSMLLAVPQAPVVRPKNGN